MVTSMCCLALLALTVCHPGIFFKSMIAKSEPREKSVDSDDSGAAV